MAEKNKKNTEEVKELDPDQMKDVAGGYLIGPADDTHEDYNKAGVSWQQNVWSKDEYYYRGQKITQERAREIVKAYKTLNP